MALIADLRPLAQIDARTEAAWSELALRAPEPNPFFEPIVARASALHLQLDITLLTVERGGDLLLCMPMRRQAFRWGRIALEAWTGWDPLSVPLLDATDREAVAAAAIARLGNARGPGLLVLDFLPSDGPVAAALDAASTGKRPAWMLARTHRPRPVLHRRDDGDYLSTTLHGRHRRKQGNRRRNLEKRLGAPLQLVDESGKLEAIERLLKMELDGWKGRIGCAVLNRPRFATYFREQCARFADQGRLQVLSLQGGGVTVAMKADIRAGESLFGLRTAYEEEFAEASPGVELEIRAVEAFHAFGVRFWDSCTNHVKNPQDWLWPDKRPLSRLVVSLRGVLGRIASSRLARAAHARWGAGADGARTR